MPMKNILSRSLSFTTVLRAMGSFFRKATTVSYHVICPKLQASFFG